MQYNLDKVTSPDFKLKVKKRDDLRDKIREFKKQETVLIFDVIRSCDHPFIKVSTARGEFPNSRSEIVVCKSCGLGLTGQIGMPPKAPMLDLSKSVIVFEPGGGDGRKEVLYMLSAVQQYALQYPMRFNRDYLAEVFGGSPYCVDKVLETDAGGYSVDDERIDDEFAFNRKVLND